MARKTPTPQEVAAELNRRGLNSDDVRRMVGNIKYRAKPTTAKTEALEADYRLIMGDKEHYERKVQRPQGAIFEGVVEEVISSLDAMQTEKVSPEEADLSVDTESLLANMMTGEQGLDVGIEAPTIAPEAPVEDSNAIYDVAELDLRPTPKEAPTSSPEASTELPPKPTMEEQPESIALELTPKPVDLSQGIELDAMSFTGEGTFTTALDDIPNVTILKPEIQEEFNTAVAMSESESPEEFVELYPQLQGNPNPSFEFYKELEKGAYLDTFTMQDSSPENLVMLQEDMYKADVESDLSRFLKSSSEWIAATDYDADQKRMLSMMTNSITPLFVARQMNDYLQIQTGKVFENAPVSELIDEAAVMLLDPIGAQERSQQRAMYSRVAGKELDYRFYRSDVLQEAIDERFDGLDFKDQLKMLELIVPALSEIEGALGTKSTIVDSFVLEDLRQALVGGNLGHDDWVSWLEAVGLGAVAGWLVRTPKVLKAFVKAGAVKVSTVRDAMHGMSIGERMNADARALAEFQAMWSPSREAPTVGKGDITVDPVTGIEQTPIFTYSDEVWDADKMLWAADKWSKRDLKELKQAEKSVAHELNKAQQRLQKQTDINKEARAIARAENIKFKDAKARVVKETKDNIENLKQEKAHLEDSRLLADRSQEGASYVARREGAERGRAKELKSLDDEIAHIEKQLKNTKAIDRQAKARTVSAKESKASGKPEKTKAQARAEIKAEMQGKIDALRGKKADITPKKERTGTRTALRTESGKLLAITQRLSPTGAKNILWPAAEARKLDRALRALGVRAEDASLSSSNKMPNDSGEGINPDNLTPDTRLTASDVKGTSKIVEDVENRGFRNVLSTAEQEAAIEKAFKRIWKHARLGDIRVEHSLTQQISENTVATVARMDAGGGKAFDNYDDAVFASMELLGADARVVAKSPSGSEFFTVSPESLARLSDEARDGLEFFVEIRKDYTFSSKDVAAMSDGSVSYLSHPAWQILLEPMDVINGNIISAVSYLRDYNIKIYKNLTKLTEEFAKLGTKDKAAATELLVSGDKGSYVHTLESASRALGKDITLDSPIWKGYAAIRNFYDEVASLRDYRERIRLDREGYMEVGLKDDVGNAVFGKPMTSSDIATAKGDKYTEVWDEATQSVTSFDEGDYWRIVELSRPLEKTTSTGEPVIVRFAKVGKLDFKPLPRNVFPRRAGHVDLAYENVGALIQVQKSRIVSGKKETWYETVKFAHTDKEANAWLDAQGQASMTRRATMENEFGSKVRVINSRETNFDMGLADLDYKGNPMPYNLRGRSDENVEFIDGEVQAKNLLDRINKSIRGVENSLERDNIDMLRQRFMETYGHILTNKGTFPDYSGKNIFSSAVGTDKQLLKEAKALLNYIKGQERMMGMAEQTELTRTINAVLAVPRVLGKNPIANFQGAARWMAIYGRPFYQVAANMLTSLDFVKRDPLRASASIIETLGFIGYRLATRGGSDSEGMAKAMGLLTGMSKEEFQLFDKTLDASGVRSAELLDNVLSGLDQVRVTSGIRRGLSNLGKLGRAPVVISTDITQLIAYRHAMKIFKDKYPDLKPFEGVGRVKMNELFRGLTFRMNKSSPLISETDEYTKLLTLFTQHVTKGFKDTILQPTVKTLTGKDISKNPSVYADSYGQAATTTFMNIALYGLAGTYSAGLFDTAGVTDEVHELFMEGLIDQSMEHLTGVDFNLQERFAYGDAITAWLSLTGLEDGALNVFGAAGLVGTRLGKLAATVRTVYDTPVMEESDMLEFTQFMASEGGEIFSQWGDIKKADMIKNFGVYFSSTGTPRFTTNPDAALAQWFSVRPDEAGVQESLIYGDDFESEYYAQDLPNFFARFAWWRLNRLANDGKLNLETFNEAVQSSIRMAQGALANKGASSLAYDAKNIILKKVVYPYTREGKLDKAFLATKLDHKFLESIWSVIENKSPSSKVKRLEMIKEGLSDQKMRAAIDLRIDLIQGTESALSEKE